MEKEYELELSVSLISGAIQDWSDPSVHVTGILY